MAERVPAIRSESLSRLVAGTCPAMTVGRTPAYRDFRSRNQEFRTISGGLISSQLQGSTVDLCRKDGLPLRRLERTTMPDSDRLRLSAQIVNLEQWCILGVKHGAVRFDRC